MQLEKTLKNKLTAKNVPEADIDRFLSYVNSARRDEEGKEERKRPVSRNDADNLYSLFVKFRNLGLIIDGTNVVITGRNMAMVTYHGYKNKVKQTYPDATFDVQLVRGEDTFKVSKRDGRVSYEHDIANPFGDDEIRGAYCVITIGDKDYFEALNPSDFAKMKESSKQKYLWGEWASEFWLKSVIKRACKRHFYDVPGMAEIDKVDNDDYGLAERVDLPDATREAIEAAVTVEELQNIMDSLSPEYKQAAQPLVEERFAAL